MIISGLKYFTELPWPCLLPKGLGVCTPYQQCGYALYFGGFRLNEIKERRSSCKKYGKELLCCENKKKAKKTPVRG